MALDLLIKVFLIPCLFMAPLAWAGPLEDFYKLFSDGHYSKALKALEKFDDKKLKSSTSKAYLFGLTYSKMQEYDKAIVQFEKAIAEKNESRDLDYEYGQALYAANDLKKATEAFKRSAKKHFNRPASFYYVAHIAQILEEHKVAKDYYVLAIKDRESDAKMRQVAYFQLAETLLSVIREKAKDPKSMTASVDKIILPLMAKAKSFDPASKTAADIAKRESEVMVEFELDPNLLKNGRRINPKRYNLSLTQKVSYDDNVSLVSEENNLDQSKKKSAIFETEAYGQYNIIIKKRVVIAPEVRFNFIQHANRKDPEVYQNDSFTSNFNLKNKYEHKFKGQPASTLLDIDHSRVSKDWNQRKTKEFYASSTTYTLGETFSYFSLGDTTLKFKMKNYTGENTAISNHTTSYSANQTFFLSIQHLILALFEMSFIDNYNNPTTNTNTYLFRVDYLIPQILPQYTLGIALSTTLTDTLEQKATKGTELTFSPSLDFSRELNSNTKVGINYEFTKNKSKEESSSYSKHVVTTEVGFTF